jgi:hypothetical protein
VGGGSSPLSCAVFLPPPLSQAFLLLITGWCCCSCQPPCLFTVHVGSGSFLLSYGVFLPLPLSQAFLLLVAGQCPHSRQRLSHLPSLFIYSPRKDSLPPIFSAQCSPPSFPRVLTALIAYCSVSLFPWVEVGLSRGLCCSGPGLSVGVPQYCKAHLVPIFPSCLGAGDWRPGALLVSLFNVKWRFSEPAGGVEGSKLCLFSVIMPAKCVSSISPRFPYRRLTFCFLPLAAILESLLFFLLISSVNVVY